MVFSGLLLGWSIFRIPLVQIFDDWTPTAVSITFTISMVSFCFGGFAGGRLIPKITSKYSLQIAAGLVLVGFELLFLLIDYEQPTRTIVLMWFAYGIFFGAGVGLAYNSVLSAITRWFPGRTGMISGILLLGFGVGGLVVGSVVDKLISIFDVETTFGITGAAIAIVYFAGSFFMKTPPEGMFLNIDTTEDQKSIKKNKIASKNYTLKEMLKTPSFWIFEIWVIMMSGAGMVVINSAAVIAVTFGAPAVLGLIISIFNGIGRPIMGTLLDYIGRKNAMMINCFIMLLGGLVLLLGNMSFNAILIFIGIPLIGLAYGGSPTMIASVPNLFYGEKHYPINFGVVNFAVGAAAIVGPIISSKLQEFADGDYATTFVMIMLMSICAFFLNVLLSYFSQKSKLE